MKSVWCNTEAVYVLFNGSYGPPSVYWKIKAISSSLSSFH